VDAGVACDGRRPILLQLRVCSTAWVSPGRTTQVVAIEFCGPTVQTCVGPSPRPVQLIRSLPTTPTTAVVHRVSSHTTEHPQPTSRGASTTQRRSRHRRGPSTRTGDHRATHHRIGRCY
jgi:hypothetical protein